MKLLVLTVSFLLFQASPARPSRQPARQRTQPAVAKPESRPLTEFVPNDAVLVMGIKPSAILKSPLAGSIIRQSGTQTEASEVLLDLKNLTGFDPLDVEEAIMFADEAEVQRVTNVRRKLATRNRMKNVGIAMYNFHDVYDMFPHPSGFRSIHEGKLSWRVSILPMLGYGDLYDQFDLDADWDAPQNLKLIGQMPKEYLTDGVTEDGKTSMHVLSGLKTPFAGNDPVNFRDIKDRTEDTVMFVQAGPDKADVWTKPGTLEVDSENPLSSLGNIGDEFCITTMDAFPLYIDSGVSSGFFKAIVEHQDGTPVIWNEADRELRNSAKDWVGILVRTVGPIDQNAILASFGTLSAKSPVTKSPDGRWFHVLNLSLSFPDDKTVVLVSNEMSQRFGLRRTAPDKSSLVHQFEFLSQRSDLTIVTSPVAMEAATTTIAASQHLPELQASMRGGTMALKLSDPSNDLAVGQIQMADRLSALQLESMLRGMLMMGRAVWLESLRKADLATPETTESAAAFMEQVQISSQNDRVGLRIEPISDPSTLCVALAPVFRNAIESHIAGRRRKKEQDREWQLKRLIMPLVEYLDEKGSLPSATWKEGLSWRVALLPYMNQQDLYHQFHLDEPWDSEHNLTLVSKMPADFACSGVETPGHTSIHVFDERGAPFGSKSPATPKELYGDRSVAVMFLAGPDKADVWTKPGGLHFDSNNPRAVLGTDTSCAIHLDGIVRQLPPDLGPAAMEKLIFLKSKSRQPASKISFDDEPIDFSQ